jgi:hypothetical protein
LKNANYRVVYTESSRPSTWAWSNLLEGVVPAESVSIMTVMFYHHNIIIFRDSFLTIISLNTEIRQRGPGGQNCGHTDTWSANAVAAVKKNIEQAEEINFAIQVVAPNRQEFGQLTVLTNNTRVNLMESLVGSEMAMQVPSVMDDVDGPANDNLQPVPGQQ